MPPELVLGEPRLHLVLDQQAPVLVVADDDIGQPFAFGIQFCLWRIARQALLANNERPGRNRRPHPKPCQEPPEECANLVETTCQRVAESVLWLAVLVEENAQRPDGDRCRKLLGLLGPRGLTTPCRIVRKSISNAKAHRDCDRRT